MNKKMFIILDDKKRPQHKYVKEEDRKTMAQALNHNNVGMIVDEPYIVLDFDDEPSFSAIKRWLSDNSIVTRIMKSDRGGHVWFKRDKPLKNGSKIQSRIGVMYDIRSYGTTGYVMIKRYGKNRDFSNYNEIVKLPAELEPMDKKLVNKSENDHLLNFVGMKKGDGRNDSLFRWVLPTIKTYPDEDKQSQMSWVRHIFDIINKYVLGDPLDDYELTAMVENNRIWDDEEKYKELVDTSKPGSTKKKFDFKAYSKKLIKDHDLKISNNKYYKYNIKGYYEFCDSHMLDSIVYEGFYDITKSQKNNTLDYMESIVDNFDLDIVMNEAKHYINVRNGLYNLNTHKLEPHTPNVFIINQLQADYDPFSYNKVLDDAINGWSNNDTQSRELLMEAVGYSFLNHLPSDKSFLLMGSGSNGKSTFLDLLTKLIGETNVSGITLNKLGTRFLTNELHNKLLNIGADVGDRLNESADFKSLSSGDIMMIEGKNERPRKFRNYATFFFAANDYPTTKDTTEGYYRRWVIINFDTKFKQLEGQKLTTFKNELYSQKSINYLLILAIEGLKRYFKNSFTNGPKQVMAKNTFITKNDSVMEWLHWDEPNLDDMEFKSAYDLYKEYMDRKRYKDRHSFVETMNTFSKYDLVVENGKKFFVKKRTN